MVSLRTFVPQRTIVPDVASSGRALRCTWHPERGTFVISHWEGRVCIASVEVAATDAAELLAVLAEGVAEAAGDDG